MKNTKILKVINLCLAVLFPIVTLSAIFRRTMYSWGWSSNVHTTPGLILICLILLHLFFNRFWIKANYFKKIKK